MLESVETKEVIENSAEGSANNFSSFQSEEKIALYDANAVQRIPVYLDDEDEANEPMVLVMQPLQDSRYIEYANNSKLKIVDDGNAIAQAKSQALGKLWNNLVSDVENVEWEGGKKPENWKDAFDLLQFKIPSMNSFLVVAVYEKPKTNNGKLVIGVVNERIIFADLYFNGKVVTTTHFLQKSNFDFANELENSQKMPFGSKAKGLQDLGDYALPNSVEGKAALYDRMVTKTAAGFVDNIVPIRVKEEIIDYIAKAVIKQKK
ncbi:MAG TPA: hypothetical protein PKY82_18990 [Pyrinomonadaceae bacterium]|nr:hypothetical protein [Pyrinomonadaceae bacterium]